MVWLVSLSLVDIVKCCLSVLHYFLFFIFFSLRQASRLSRMVRKISPHLFFFVFKSFTSIFRKPFTRVTFAVCPRARSVWCDLNNNKLLVICYICHYFISSSLSNAVLRQMQHHRTLYCNTKSVHWATGDFLSSNSLRHLPSQLQDRRGQRLCCRGVALASGGDHGFLFALRWLPHQ